MIDLRHLTIITVLRFQQALHNLTLGLLHYTPANTLGISQYVCSIADLPRSRLVKYPLLLKQIYKHVSIIG